MSNETISNLNDLIDHVKARYEEVKSGIEDDLTIDEYDLDSELIRTPKVYSKYSAMFADETVNLKHLYTHKEKLKLERWKYWAGRQSDSYYATHGPVHEKILKSDLDMYMSSDAILALINEAITYQKALTDLIERTLKEISSRSFHIKSMIDWRKFTSGG